MCATVLIMESRTRFEDKYDDALINCHRCKLYTFIQLYSISVNQKKVLLQSVSNKTQDLYRL